VLDDLTGHQVIQKLTHIARRPRDPQQFRDVIQLGYRLRQNGVEDVVRLLEHWSGIKLESNDDGWQSQLKTWRIWYQQNWPEQEEISIEATNETGGYSVEQILGFLETNGLGNKQQGQHLFVAAQCAQCHQVDSVGQNIGPDLRSLANRFSIREVLEATIEPSKHIPDRYESKVILTTDGQQFSGMAVAYADGTFLILESNGHRVRIANDDIEEVRDSEVSAMPANLLDDLSLSEISDLVAFLIQGKNNVAEKNDRQSEIAR
jgi:putative heme-binding domain-containing protein